MRKLEPKIHNGIKIVCPRCKTFAWHGPQQYPIAGPDKLYHHPGCVKVRSV